MVEAKNKGGRPSIYTEELAEDICRRFVEGDRGIHRLCQDSDDLPNPDTFWRWKREKPEFSEMFTRAREQQADRMAFDGLRLLQLVELDEDSKINNAIVTHARNQADYILKLIPKIAPKTMGDTQKHLMGGALDAPAIRIQDDSMVDALDEETQAELRAILRKATTKGDA